MAHACDGLRTMATAYEPRDREAFDEGYTKAQWLDPAGEEAGGDKTLRREVHRLWNAQRLLHFAASEPAELKDGASIWRGLQLSERAQDKVQQGIETCEHYKGGLSTRWQKRPVEPCGRVTCLSVCVDGEALDAEWVANYGGRSAAVERARWMYQHRFRRDPGPVRCNFGTV